MYIIAYREVIGEGRLHFFGIGYSIVYIFCNGDCNLVAELFFYNYLIIMHQSCNDQLKKTVSRGK